MLQIKDIRKKYTTGDLVQTALDGVSLNLRDNEFVAILGPSGSGKTTLLNVIGGLDRYDSGDLIINGISTKNYTDRDWDSYRNHTIGFIFQSYNLIPHQTVLANVELALTISGISRRERRRRAKKALEDVGLGNQLHKKPNQMSGGQMQRVAIARALVNNPDILLADEPTGALDSDTSVQVMELLKEVSNDRLVVMVTHNPELAEEYANRIVRLRDGHITDDTNPYVVEDEILEPPQHKNMGRSSMSAFTSLSLSFNNLWTKKARTLLTSFAGSIGIIGIALIMSLSTGFQKYIDKIQEDTLSTYPLTIQSETADMTSAMASFGAAITDGEDVEPGMVREQQMMAQMFAQIGSNDLGAFKEHLDGSMDEIGDTINALKYGYSISPRIFASDTSEKITQVNPSNLFGDITGNSMMSAYMDSNAFHEMIDNIELLDSQYDVLSGRWPESSDELVMVLNDPGSMTDYTAYVLGLHDPAELSEMIQQVMAGKEVEEIGTPMEWSYDELMSLTFRLVHAWQMYSYNEEYMVWEDMSKDEEYMRSVIDSSLELRIVGIVSPKEGVAASALSPGICYTSALTQYIIDAAEGSEIVSAQLSDSDVDVFTGEAFSSLGESGSGLDFQNMISVDTNMLSSAFNMNLDDSFVTEMLQDYLKELAGSVTVDTVPAQNDFLDTLEILAVDMLSSYIAENADPQTGLAQLRLADAEAIVDSYLSGSEPSAIISSLESKYHMTDSIAQVYRPLLMGFVTSCITAAMPDADLPDVEIPDVEIPDVEIPDIEIPDVEIPDIEIPDVEIPDVDTPDTDTPDVDNPGTDTSETPSDPTGSTTTTQPETSTTTTPPTTTATSVTEDTTQPTGSAGTPVMAVVRLVPSASLLGEIALSAGLAATSGSDVIVSGSDASSPVIPDSLPSIDIEAFSAQISADMVETAAAEYTSSVLVKGTSAVMALSMTQADFQNQIIEKLSSFSSEIFGSLAGNLNVDADKIASAFQFNMDEEELSRLMDVFSGNSTERTADSNLRSLGYADRSQPSSISIYLVDFAAKERFLDFIDSYNKDMEESGNEDLVITYTDLTGVLMSSVKTIVDSVSYVLIAFVGVSLVVSSIMIGIITYISVLERTKEIGVLRAIGASKKNISQVFNAETFIIGLCSGVIGVGVTLLLLPVINAIIHSLVDSADINAQLPVVSAVVLVILSMILTLIGGLIPSKKAATKDPVIALRSE